MAPSLIGALVMFLGGTLVSLGIFAMNLRVLKKKPEALPSLSPVRMLLNLGYLTAVFILRRNLPWGDAGPLLGATVGLTVPSILFSLRLAKINDAMHAASRPDREKGGKEHG